MTLAELNQHLELIEKIEKANELLASLRTAATPGAAKLTGMPRAPGVADKVGDLAVEIADISSRIDFLTAELEQSRPPIEAFIAGIEDDQTRLIFRLRFLRGLTWGEVAGVLGRYTTEKGVSDLCYKYMKTAGQN